MAEIIGYDEDGNPIYGYGEAVPTPTQNAQPVAGPDMADDPQTYQAQPEALVPAPPPVTPPPDSGLTYNPAAYEPTYATPPPEQEIEPPASQYTETSTAAPVPAPAPTQGSPYTGGASQYYGEGGSVNGTVTPRSVPGVGSLSGSSVLYPAGSAGGGNWTPTSSPSMVAQANASEFASELAAANRRRSWSDFVPVPGDRGTSPLLVEGMRLARQDRESIDPTDRYNLYPEGQSPADSLGTMTEEETQSLPPWLRGIATASGVGWRDPSLTYSDAGFMVDPALIGFGSGRATSRAAQAADDIFMPTNRTAQPEAPTQVRDIPEPPPTKKVVDIPTEIDPAIREAMDLEGKGGWRSGLGYDWSDASFATRSRSYPGVSSRPTTTSKPPPVPPPTRTLSDPRAARGVAPPRTRTTQDPRAAANTRPETPLTPEDAWIPAQQAQAKQVTDDLARRSQQWGAESSAPTIKPRSMEELRQQQLVSRLRSPFWEKPGSKPMAQQPTVVRRPSSGISNPANYATATPTGPTVPAPTPRGGRLGTGKKIALGSAAVGAIGAGLNAARQEQFPWQKTPADAATDERDQDVVTKPGQADVTREGAPAPKSTGENPAGLRPGEKKQTHVSGVEIVKDKNGNEVAVVNEKGVREDIEKVGDVATEDEIHAAIDDVISRPGWPGNQTVSQPATNEPVSAGTVGPLATGTAAAALDAGTPAATPMVTAQPSSDVEEFVNTFSGGGSSGRSSSRYSGGSSSRYGRRRKGKRSSGSRTSSMFGEGFPFNRPDSPIRQQILAAIAASLAKGKGR